MRIHKQTYLTRAEPSPHGADASCIITTGINDRDNESLDVMGLDMKNYQRNPVVLFAHDYRALPVGKCTRLEVSPTAGIRAEWNFLPGDPFADRVANAWRHGVLNACSIGFRAIEVVPGKSGGRRFVKSELLEFSIVPVPANADAVRTLKTYGLYSSSVAKAGRALSALNEQHVREALNHASGCSNHLSEVLRCLDRDDDTEVELDDDDVALELADDEDMLDIDPADLAAAFRQVATDLRRQARHAADPLALDRVRHRNATIDSRDVVDILPGAVASVLREHLGQAVGNEVRIALRKLKGRLD